MTLFVAEDQLTLVSANKQLSEGILEQVARIGNALVNPKRLKILEFLSQSPRTVEAIARGVVEFENLTSRRTNIFDY